jgi:hypothetical protein
LSKFGLKLVPWNAVFPILIETCDAKPVIRQLQADGEVAPMAVVFTL